MSDKPSFRATFVPITAENAVRKTRRRVDQLSELLQGKTWEAFESDKLLQLAVEHNYWMTGQLLTILATERGARMALKAEQVISIAGLDLDYADRLVTEYECVRPDEVWTSIHKCLPALKQQINAWADELGMEPPPGQTR